MPNTRETTIKRLKMRSMRRGIKEMDLILPPFANAHIDDLSDADLTTFEALLSENDHDLYQWVTGLVAAPEPYQALIAQIAAVSIGVVRPA